MCIITTAALSTATSVTMALASAATAAATTAVTLPQASAQRKTTEFQAEQMRKQAQQAEMEAAYERQEGIEEARRQKIASILNFFVSKFYISSLYFIIKIQYFNIKFRILKQTLK